MALNLRRTHPQFWLVFVATALYHLSLGLVQCFGNPDLFQAPSQLYVYEFISKEAWGIGHLVVAAGMLIGLTRPTFGLARLALAGGAFLTLARLIFLIEAAVKGAGGAVGIPVYILIAALHIAQTLEPPSNPAAAR